MKNQINQTKLIDANEFYENLVEQAITDEDRRFCDKVKFALDKQKEVNIVTHKIGTWEIVGRETGAFGVEYQIKKCSKCGFTHSLLIPDNFCPKCGEEKIISHIRRYNNEVGNS